MQSLALKDGYTVFALTSSFGHWAPQRICALAGMLSTRATAARVAIERDFIGFILIDLLRDRLSDGLTDRTLGFFRLFPFGARAASAEAARNEAEAGANGPALTSPRASHPAGANRRD